jgi:hypothetical protein
MVWSAVCLRIAACLGAWLALSGLRSDLGCFARELTGLYCPNRLKIRLLQSFNGFTVWQNFQKLLYLGQIAEFEEKNRMPGLNRRSRGWHATTRQTQMKRGA